MRFAKGVIAFAVVNPAAALSPSPSPGLLNSGPLLSSPPAVCSPPAPALSDWEVLRERRRIFKRQRRRDRNGVVAKT